MTRYFRWAGALWLGLIMAATHAGWAKPLVTVPYTQVAAQHDAACLVKVRVGPLKNLTFLIDTAATRSAITPAVRTALGLKTVEAASEVVTGAGGVITAQRFILPDLGIGDATQFDLRVLVLDLGSADNWMGVKLDGILGLDYLRNYDVRFNAAEGTLELSALSNHPELPEDRDMYSRIPFRMASVGFMIVPVMVNDRLLVGVLDTGSSRCVLNSRAAAAAGMAPKDGEPLTTTGADRTEVRITLQTAKRIDVGGISFRDEPVSVGDLVVFEQYGLESLPSAIIGGSVMKDRDVYISYSTNELFVSRNTTKWADSAGK